MRHSWHVPRVGQMQPRAAVEARCAECRRDFFPPDPRTPRCSMCQGSRAQAVVAHRALLRELEALVPTVPTPPLGACEAGFPGPEDWWGSV